MRLAEHIENEYMQKEKETHRLSGYNSRGKKRRPHTKISEGLIGSIVNYCNMKSSEL